MTIAILEGKDSGQPKMMLMLVALVLALGTSPSWSAPVPWELVDMTYTLDENNLHWPTVKGFTKTVKYNGTYDDYWFLLEEYSSSTHVGTHMDAPCHFAKDVWCVDQIPLRRLRGPAAVVDITDKVSANPDAMVEVEDLLGWEFLSGTSLNGTIVVMRSGWGRRWGDQLAFTGSTVEGSVDDLHFPGISPEAAQWLVDHRDVFGVTSESMSLDNGPSKDFMAHRILNGNNIWGLETVANVEQLPLVGAYLTVMPMKIGGGSGAQTRVVASFPKVIFKTDYLTERLMQEVPSSAEIAV